MSGDKSQLQKIKSYNLETFVFSVDGWIHINSNTRLVKRKPKLDKLIPCSLNVVAAHVSAWILTQPVLFLVQPGQWIH